jgi:adenylyltransferase/sulfurtransferase
MQIEWWDAKRLRQARALVIGAGALGNELVKNLLLLGWGTIVIADFDRVEESNLSRSVLFDPSSVGKPKVEAIVQSAARLNPECTVVGLGTDVRLAVGAGLPARMDVVFGCVDNVAARVALGQLAGRSGSLVIDGGLTTWEGTVRVLLPPDGPCYVCGLTEEDHREIRLRRSCLAYAARSQAASGMPTTPTVASATAALMAQQALKWLHRDSHDLNLAVGCEIRIDLAHDRFWMTRLVLNKQCVLHPEPSLPATAAPVSWEGSWLNALEYARGKLGDPGLTFRLPVPVLSGWTCPQCDAAGTVCRAHLPDAPVLCTTCGQRAVPDLVYVLTGEEPWVQLSPRAMGFPPWTWIEAEGETVSEVLELAGAPPELAVVADVSRP